MCTTSPSRHKQTLSHPEARRPDVSSVPAATSEPQNSEVAATAVQDEFIPAKISLPSLAPSTPASQDEMAAAQRQIIERFGEITIKPTQIKKYYFKDEGGFVPAHLFDVITGMGMTLARLHNGSDSHQPDINEPDLLFYAPKDPNNPSRLFGSGSFTDFFPDKDYVLIGWGYYSDYIPGQVPQLEGASDEDWFVHEAGYHTLDGGFLPTPPEEEYRGQNPSSGPTKEDSKQGHLTLGKHGRVWDLHVWRTDLLTGTDSAPVVQVYAPKDHPLMPKKTLDLPAESFFVPEWPLKNTILAHTDSAD